MQASNIGGKGAMLLFSNAQVGHIFTLPNATIVVK